MARGRLVPTHALNSAKVSSAIGRSLLGAILALTLAAPSQGTDSLIEAASLA